jgi:hypothetical protein
MHAVAAKTTLPVRPVATQSRPIASFQRAGNQAVARMLASRTIQAKLVIAPSGDPHEREADYAAEAVMRMPAGAPSLAPVLSRVSPPPVHRKCTQCEEEQRQGQPAGNPALPQHECPSCEEEKDIQRKASTGGGTREIGPSVETSIEAARSGGHPLPRRLRSRFEPRFGADLSGVRLHTDRGAAELAGAVGAHAFTNRKDIFFAAGRYKPDSQEGQRLLAHELTHTIQQEGYDGATVQREEAAPHEETPAQDVEINWKDKILIESIAGPALTLGTTAHSLAKATVTGFVKEVKVQAARRGSELWEKIKALFSVTGAASFILHYWWGLVKGIFSPITGLIDLAKLAIKLQMLSNQILATAWTRRADLADDAVKIGAGMSALADRVGKFLGSLKEHPIDTVKGLANWFSMLGDRAIAKAEAGGRDAAKALLAVLDKPLNELGELAGEIVGTLLINIVLLVFTEGIGNAITQIAGKLGEFGSFLGKFGKAAEMLGVIATKVGELLGTLGTWITEAEAAIAKIAETVLKPIGPILEEFGKLVSGLRSFLRKLLGVSQEAAAGAVEQAAGGAARVAESAKPPVAAPKPAPKAPAPRVPEPAVKPAVKPAIKPEPPVGSAEEGGALGGSKAAPAPEAAPPPKPGAAAPESKLFEGISPETEELLARRPGLKKILSEHPKAADLFKLCKSDCFPGFMSDEQIAERLVRLEKIEAEATRLGQPLDRAKTKELLHAQTNIEEVDKALGSLEKQVFGAVEAAEAGKVGTYTTKIKWGIHNVEARPFGPGYWGKRTVQVNPRVNAYELKINPNNESFFLPHPDGGFVQFEKIAARTVQDGKLIIQPKSIYHVADMPAFARESVLTEARRQIQAAGPAGLKVEWLVSDPKALTQLGDLFKAEGISITLTPLAE